MRLPHLNSGDIVDVVAPASACSRQELKKGVAAIRALGLEPRVPRDIFAKSLLFSNSDEKRLQHFRRALYAPDSKMLWCARGGYGAIRLMPEINRWPRPKLKKILLGYSDITTLHVYFNQKWHWPTLHGPLVDRLGRGVMLPRERKELLGLLFGDLNEVEFRGLKPFNRAARVKRALRAPIYGGNMTVLQSGLGTPTALDPHSCFLFFEDLGERPHRVDRMLTQFEQAGWFKTCRAILLGDFLLKEPSDRRGLWRDVFARFAESTRIPVVYGLPVGHHPRRQRTLPLNTGATLNLGPSISLRVDGGIQIL